jgi:hypothetical protein
MKPLEPVYVVDLFEPMLNRLLELLGQLSEEEWCLAKPCEGWTVKDVALHLLGMMLASFREEEIRIPCNYRVRLYIGN